MSKSSHSHKAQPKNSIIPAQIDWRIDDNGNTVPVSHQFGDVYYSLVDGLAESRYVFLEQNHLPCRLEHFLTTTLTYPRTFTIAELGFGTGLNFFATWQLWKQLLQANPSTKHHLHFISFEKFPLTITDFAKSLASWKTKAPEIAPLIDKFIANYPTLIAGCHRINFTTDNLTLDIWLGDARDNLQRLSNGKINAWFLDGFAPSCNESLWAEQIFTEIARLSDADSTVATFSCAGIVKRGLKNIGFDIAKVKGFGRKREMLTASLDNSEGLKQVVENINTDTTKYDNQISIIGSGVSGLMTAWSMANRGFQVTLIDKTAPLAGASGNPRGVLSPKMTPIHHVEEHLHSIGYLYASRVYQQMAQGLANNDTNLTILESTGVMDLMLKANISCEQIREYPDDFAKVLDEKLAQEITGLTGDGLDKLKNNQFLPQAGLINTKALAQCVLSHPSITFAQHEIVNIDEKIDCVILNTTDSKNIATGHAIICLAYESCQLDKRIFDFRKIRGQISWFIPTKEQLKKLPKIPMKYGGYCASFTDIQSQEPQFLLGASFIRNDISAEIRESEHQESRDKLVNTMPELANVISEETTSWQARVGIRSQTPDYHPLIGKVGDSKRIWTMSGMGAKGYAFAPICAEILTDLILENIPPVSSAMLAKLSPNRKRLKKPLDETK